MSMSLKPSSNPTPAQAPAEGRPSLLVRGARAEERLLALLRTRAPEALRVTLALVFLWFGALKVAGVPTLPSGLIAAITPFLDPAVSVPAVGAVELLLGGLLLLGWRQPLVLAALGAHLAGTLLVLVLRPDVAFQGGNPLLPSVEGEYVIKNLVLLASVAVLAGQTRSRALAPLRHRS